MEEEKSIEPVSMETRLGDIKSYKNLLTADMTNDFFMMPFMNLVMKVVDEKGFLTNKGLMLLHQDIQDIMGKLKEGAGDRDRVRAGLYFTICLNLGIIFISFVKGMDEEECKQYKELFDEELREFLVIIAGRMEELLPTFRMVLSNELPKLSDKYAKVYDTEKRDSFTKDIYDKTPLYISNTDMPDVEGAKEIPKQ
jgi:hypothetical protein